MLDAARELTHLGWSPVGLEEPWSAQASGTVLIDRKDGETA